MEELIRDWSGDHVVARHDHDARAWVFIAIHSTRLGPASGGTRMRIYETPSDGLRDAQRLAAGMTYKWAGVDFPRGGGKGVIALSRQLEGPERDALLERYGSLVEALRGGFTTGPDLGVGPDLARVISRTTGYVSGVKGACDPGPWTALGVVAAMEAAASAALGASDLRGLTILVQGAGDVGIPLCRSLTRRGARLKVADIDEERARALAEEVDAELVDVGATYDEPCDIFAPCAIGGVLNTVTIPRLQCRIIAGSANNQLETTRDADLLEQRGILYAPDFIANAGGAVYIVGIESLEMDNDAVTAKILSINDTLTEIFREARERGESPLKAAERRARRVLERGPV